MHFLLNMMIYMDNVHCKCSIGLLADTCIQVLTIRNFNTYICYKSFSSSKNVCNVLLNMIDYMDNVNVQLYI